MAVSFNGSSDAYDMGTVLGFAASAPMSMCCWINFASFGSGGTIQTFLSKGYDGSVTSYQFQFVAGTPNTLFWGSFDGALTHGPTWTSTLSTGAWHHVYGHYTGSLTTTWTLYIDGVFAASSFDATGPQVPGRKFQIGAVDNNGAPLQFFNGCMADAAVFNGPLNTTEITALGNGTLRPNTGMSQTLLGYWPLTAGGTTTPDTSGNSLTGNQMTSTPGTCGSSPTFAAPFLPPTFTQSPILQVRNRVLSY